MNEFCRREIAPGLFLLIEPNVSVLDQRVIMQILAWG